MMVMSQTRRLKRLIFIHKKSEDALRWAIRLERTEDKEAAETLRLYALCSKFHCLPSQLEKEESVLLDSFEIILDQEGRELKKKQNEMTAKSLATMKK